MSDLEFNAFVRTPFQVQAALITDENIDTVADMIAAKVVEDETGKHIVINRKVIPSVGKAYVGWYLTSFGDAYRCYAPKVFENQFVEMPEDGRTTFSFKDTKSYAVLVETEGSAEVAVGDAVLPPPPPESWPSDPSILEDADL